MISALNSWLVEPIKASLFASLPGCHALTARTRRRRYPLMYIVWQLCFSFSRPMDGKSWGEHR